MLAVICCLEAWRHFLEESRSKFEVWTDHKNLEYFMSNQKLNYKQVMMGGGKGNLKIWFVRGKRWF